MKVILDLIHCLISYIDDSRGGAIYSACDDITVSLKDSSTTLILFSNSSASGFWVMELFFAIDGVMMVGSTISFENNSTTVFSNNNAHHEGTCVYSDIL